MNSLEINKRITSIIKERIQKKSKIVSILSDILDLGPKAIYRRLNHEVFFTFSEVCKLSSTLGISLDEFVKNSLIDIHSNGILSLPDSKEHMEKLIKLLAHIKHTATKISQYDNSEMGIITNGIPPIFYSFDKEILTFCSYFTNYQYITDKTYSEFKKDSMIQPVINEIYDLYQECLNIKNHRILICRDAMKIVLEAMNYMRNIYSVTEEEYCNFKRIIGKIIDQMEEICNLGYLLDPQIKCDIHLSDVRRNTNCLFIWSESISVSSIQMYILGRKISFDQNHNDKIRNWMDIWKNNSVLITKCNIHERVHFFENQREILSNF